MTEGGMDLREIAGCTCLRLRRTTRRATQIYDHALAPVGLTITQLGLLGYIYGAGVRNPSGLPIGVLADQLGMDPTTLNRNLKPLEAKRLVESGTDLSDRRVRVLHITGRGKAKLDEAAPRWREAQDRLTRTLGLETTLALNGLLDLAATKLATQADDSAER